MPCSLLSARARERAISIRLVSIQHESVVASRYDMVARCARTSSCGSVACCVRRSGTGFCGSTTHRVRVRRVGGGEMNVCVRCVRRVVTFTVRSEPVLWSLRSGDPCTMYVSRARAGLCCLGTVFYRGAVWKSVYAPKTHNKPNGTSAHDIDNNIVPTRGHSRLRRSSVITNRSNILSGTRSGTDLCTRAVGRPAHSLPTPLRKRLRKTRAPRRVWRCQTSPSGRAGSR